MQGFVVHPGSGTVIALRECRIAFSSDDENGDSSESVIDNALFVMDGTEMETFLIDTVAPAYQKEDQ